MAKQTLLPKFYAILRQLGLGEREKQMVKDAAGVDSMSEMTDAQIIDAIIRLQQMYTPNPLEKGATTVYEQKNDNADKYRKRVIAVIGEYLALKGYPNNIDYIKATALQATGNEFKSFNQIPLSRLANLYNSYMKMNRDCKNVVHMDNQLNRLSIINN